MFCSHRVLLGFTGFNLLLVLGIGFLFRFTGFLLGLSGFSWVESSLMAFHLVLQGFTWCNWVLMGLTKLFWF